MTQPETAVGGEAVEIPQSPEDRLNAAFADPDNQKQEDELPAEETEGDEPPVADAEDELELEEEADDLPPIEAPVSWDAEAKAKFADLPRDTQEYLAKREGERERFVQQKSQEATRAKSDALQQATNELAQIEQSYAQHYQQIADSIQVSEPDPMLQVTDPVAYAQQMRTFQQANAQRAQAQQAAQQHAQQAQWQAQQAQQAEHAEQHRVIVDQFPEYLDPTTGPQIQRNLSEVARELGYSPELIAQARASDILAMRTAADWKAKASKYDALISKRMEKVRAAKTLPKVAKPGSAQAPGTQRQQQYASDREAMRGGDKDATARVLDSFFQPSK